MEDKKYSMKEIAQMALDVQAASNLSGCVHSFSRLLPSLREHIGGSPNEHAASILFATQIGYLTKAYSICDSSELYNYAYRWAYNQAKNEDIIPWEPPNEA